MASIKTRKLEDALRRLTDAFDALEMLGNDPEHEDEATRHLLVYRGICDDLAGSGLTMGLLRPRFLEVLRNHQLRASPSGVINLKVAYRATTNLLNVLLGEN